MKEEERGVRMMEEEEGGRGRKRREEEEGVMKEEEEKERGGSTFVMQANCYVRFNIFSRFVYYSVLYNNNSVSYTYTLASLYIE